MRESHGVTRQQPPTAGWRRVQQVRREVTLAIVPGATHLFEEPGTLERVAELAGNWFPRYLRPALSARRG